MVSIHPLLFPANLTFLQAKAGLMDLGAQEGYCAGTMVCVPGPSPQGSFGLAPWPGAEGLPVRAKGPGWVLPETADLGASWQGFLPQDPQEAAGTQGPHLTGDSTASGALLSLRPPS